MLSLLTMLHELGHYSMARLFGVTVKEFSVGMGPKLCGKISSKTGIAYSLRALPIGGYVSMAGEDEDSDDPNALNHKPVWQRIIITAAGAVTNLIIGFLLMAVVVVGTPNLGGTTIYEFMSEEAPSKLSGLCEEDKILRVGSTRVRTASELAYELMHQGVEPVDLTVKRNGETMVLHDVTFATMTEQGMTYGELDFRVYAVRKDFGAVVEQSFFRSLSTVKMIWESLIDLVTGRYGVEQMSGPVGITSAVGEAAAAGPIDFLYLVVVISMNLGVFNLLPLPALDGGRLIFLLIALIRRKPVDAELEGMIHFVGIVLLMILMVFITMQDITKLFTK